MLFGAQVCVQNLLHTGLQSGQGRGGGRAGAGGSAYPGPLLRQVRVSTGAELHGGNRNEIFLAGTVPEMPVCVRLEDLPPGLRRGVHRRGGCPALLLRIEEPEQVLRERRVLGG